MKARYAPRLISAVVVLSFVAAACGDDDDDAGGGEPASCEVGQTDGNLAI